MKTLTLKHLAALLATALLSSFALHAVELENYPNNQNVELEWQNSEDTQIEIEEAYISYKYIGGFWQVITFTAPDTAFQKDFYLVLNSESGYTVKSKFTGTSDDLNFNKGNIVWLGSENGRARFIMATSTYNGNFYSIAGVYNLYAKIGGVQYHVEYFLL